MKEPEEKVETPEEVAERQRINAAMFDYFFG
jgi:hypothetical protein